MNFQPIASYGLIGNLASCALVCKNGSIDWCCFPRLDSPSVFAGILDPEKGGCFQIAPAEETLKNSQYYLPDTNILHTEFETATGCIDVTDWMHMEGGGPHVTEQQHIPAIYRQIRCTKGSMKVRVRFDPRLDYGRAIMSLRPIEDGIVADSKDDKVTLWGRGPFTISGRGAEAIVELVAGQEITYICVYGNLQMQELPSPEHSHRSTIEYWLKWIKEGGEAAHSSLGEWYEFAARSSIVLKTLSGSQGIAAAATTSLPEIFGGSDNWDYRFNWIRDSSFTVQALSSLGHLYDSWQFLDWLCCVLNTQGRRPADLQILYPLNGLAITEEELPHLRGYRDSRPVRIGNGAAGQRQLDIYGEILDTVYRSESLHPSTEHALMLVLRDIVEYVCDIWHEADHGIWETRQEGRHHLYSKVMCWVAIDRGIRMAEHHQWNVDLTRWKKERDAIRMTVMEKGFNKKRNAFTQSFDDDIIDATALLFPVLEFIPPDHPYALATLDTVQKTLAEGALVYRSEMHRNMNEGAFGLCSFWLVDGLVFAGKTEQAREHFLELLKYRNHVGLYAEEIQPKTGEFLGNFPQAFTHVGLINSALYLARAAGSPQPPIPVIGEGEANVPPGENMPST